MKYRQHTIYYIWTLIVLCLMSYYIHRDHINLAQAMHDYNYSTEMQISELPMVLQCKFK